jgi:hypothetical protein
MNSAHVPPRYSAQKASSGKPFEETERNSWDPNEVGNTQIEFPGDIGLQCMGDGNAPAGRDLRQGTLIR